MTEKYTFINVRLTQGEAQLLEALVAEDTKVLDMPMDRSKTVKRLIRQEVLRRIPVLTGKGDEIGDALKNKALAKKGSPQ